MTPSNRTLEVGSVQIDVVPVTIEQCPVADDPFMDLASLGTANCVG